MNKRPPCAGKSELFDSTEYVDHLAAKAICDTCPLIAACRLNLAETRAAASVHAYGPSGTWAGQLVGVVTRRSTPDDPDSPACSECSRQSTSARGLTRGLCGTCYERMRRDGTLSVHGRRYRSRAETAREWEELAAQGLTRKEAAERLGVTHGALNKAISKTRAAA